MVEILEKPGSVTKRCTSSNSPSKCRASGGYSVILPTHEQFPSTARSGSSDLVNLKELQVVRKRPSKRAKVKVNINPQRFCDKEDNGILEIAIHEGFISEQGVAHGYIRGILWPPGYVYNQKPATVASEFEHEKPLLGGREKNTDIIGWEAIL